MYKNDLADTSRMAVEGKRYYSVLCVHGHASLERWLETDSFKLTKLEVSSLVVVNNLFMGKVDRFDQFRSTNSIMSSEKGVPRSTFTYSLDLYLQNTFSILQTIIIPGEVLYSVREFKR